MRELVLTPKFKRAFRKFTKRSAKLQQQIENTLRTYPKKPQRQKRNMSNEPSPLSSL
jgi:hypothetical protein